MPKYDSSQFDPPAAVAQVILRDASTGVVVTDVSLLIDTGADLTLLPSDAVRRLGVNPIAGANYELVGFDGSRSSAQAVDLDMVFLGRAFRGRYALTDAGRGVLGRDILMSVALLFDGPHQEWSEHRP